MDRVESKQDQSKSEEYESDFEDSESSSSEDDSGSEWERQIRHRRPVVNNHIQKNIKINKSSKIDIKE